jgi:hypothetical protein
VRLEIPKAAECLSADRLGDFKIAALILSMFSGVLTVLEGPLCFFCTLPVSLNVSTHKQIDFRSGTRPTGAILKWFLKARRVAMIERLKEK